MGVGKNRINALATSGNFNSIKAESYHGYITSVTSKTQLPFTAFISGSSLPMALMNRD
jgi:hypothetical protein